MKLMIGWTLLTISLWGCQSGATGEQSQPETYFPVDTGITHLPDVKSQMISTERLNMHVLTYRESGEAVIFLHGNFSSATYWEELMVLLPEGFRGIAPDLRGYGWTEDKTIDATRGAHDWSDDVYSLMKTMSLSKAHLVGWSMGGGVIYAFLADHSDMVLSATLVSPVSPFGFGGTKDLEGTPNNGDFSGSGGGTVNPQFIAQITAGDRSDSTQNSPRNVINTYYYKPPFKAAREEDFLTAALQEKTGEQKYSGDFAASEYWPNVAPGKYGPINALSPKYVINDVDKIISAANKPPVLWVRGSDDLIVSDNSLFDFATLGKLGYVPGWPGEEAAPPQPMVSQTREVLEQYAANGGSFEEVVIPETAHGPQIEKPTAFNEVFHKLLSNTKE